MNHILIIGAGRSSTVLIDYLKEYGAKRRSRLTVADANLQLAQEKLGEALTTTRAIAMDIFQEDQLQLAVQEADIIISMVPPAFHPLIAKVCLQFKKHMLSASYVSEEIKQMQEQVAGAGVLFLKECGLDPGIDHMTAMEVIDSIRKGGGELTSFKSFTGGLVAPESDDNLWNYKFSWNPRNVVLAGQGVASYIEKGEYKYIPYQKLFTRLEPIQVESLGEFEGYANRDSLQYRQLYNIEDISTLLRGTIRKKGFSTAWNVFVQLGMTDDTYEMKGVEKMSRRDFLNAFLPFNPYQSVEEKLCAYTGIRAGGDEFNKIKWLGLFGNDLLEVRKGSPAQVLQHILEEKWKLSPQDKDMIVMQHKFEYKLKGENWEKVSTLVCIGDDSKRTAMAKTVGLPLGIAARLLAEGKIKRRGVCIPVYPDLYEPILEELKSFGIQMVERDKKVS